MPLSGIRRFVVKPLSDIQTIWSEPWVGWVMFLFLLILGVMEYMERGIIRDAFRGLISPMERRGYIQTETQLVTHVLGWLFRTGVLGMGLYVVVGDMTHCYPLGWLVAGAMVTGMHGVKLALAGWINYLFQLTRHFRLIYVHYVAVWTGVAMMVYPCVLAAIRWEGVLPMHLLLYLLTGFYALAVTIKLLCSVPMRWITIPSILLYVLTVEVLPIAGVVYALQTWNL